ncbi:MAG: hypothetical protein AAB538_03350 [Patescibacteria group bacterium]
MKKRLAAQLGLLALMIAVQPLEWHFVRAAAADWQEARQRRRLLDELTQLNTQLSTTLDQQQRTQPHVLGTAPNTIDLVKQTDHLEDNAAKYGLTVTLQNISEEEDETIAPLRPLRILLTSTGPSGQLLRYLDALEHDPHLNRIADFELKTVGPPEAPTWQLNAEAEYFFSL